MIYAPLIPLQFGTDSGYQNVEDVKQLIKFHLTNLLLTNPGERITLPDYGVGLRKYLFENANTGVEDLIEARIRSQVSTYLPYLDLQALSAKNSSTHVISLTIQYSVDSVNLSDVLSIDLDLSSGNITTDTLGVNY